MASSSQGIPFQQSSTTMQLALSQPVQLQRHTTTQQQSTNRNSTSTKQKPKQKKKKNKRKKKKNWLLIKDDHDKNTYYRPSKYLKMPYKLLHHTLCIKLQHNFISNKERFFVFLRLRLFDELCYMDTLLQLWQNYYQIGVQHQLWPDHIKKMIPRNDNHSLQQFVDEQIFQMQHRLNVCKTQCRSQISSCPSTLIINVIDQPLKQFVLSHQKHLFYKMNSEIRRFREQRQEQQLFTLLNYHSFNSEKQNLFNRIKNIRQNQLQLFETLVRLEQHILCQFLPKAYSQIDYDLAPANLTTMRITGSTLTEITNNTKKIVRREQRTRLENELERYETMILDHEDQYQQGVIELEQCFAHQIHHGIPLIDTIKNYLNFKTDKTIRDITHNLVVLRMKIVSRRRCYMAKKIKIDPSSEVIIDSPDVSFKLEQIAYLSRGPNYIRPNQSWLLTRSKQNQWIEKEHKTVMDKIAPHLLRQYSIQSKHQIIKNLADQLKIQFHHGYTTPLSTRDVLRTQNDFRIMNAIRRKLKRNKLILRLTDKSNILYICRSIDFDKKVQAYRVKTNAYQELASNPLDEILYKVTRLLNDLRAKNLIQANQYEKMMPKRDKVRLGYMYFNPKVHKENIPLRPIISSIRAPATPISKFLDQLLRPIFDYHVAKTSIINGLDLIHRLTKYVNDGYLQPTTLFCTFDITDLYTMLPQEESLKILEIFLQEHNIEKINTIKVETIIDLARIVLTENAFIYDNKYYKQILGGAMGSPFTMTLANIFMWYWEKELVADLHSSHEIYGRYIDDVFFTWNGSLPALTTLLKNLNGKHPKIKLVYDIGLNISFLDVLLTNENGILLTSVYHKEAAEPYVVPFTSDHPPHIFRNIITNALNRAVRYSSTFEAFNRERRFIRLKLLYNGYPSNYIDIQFRKFFTKHNLLTLPSLLPIINRSDQFFTLRDQLLRNLNASTINTSRNRITVTRDSNRPTSISVTRVWQQTNPQLPVPLIIHVPHENRLRFLSKYLRESWSNIFQNTNVRQTKLIVGTTTRRNIKRELAQACPPLSKIKLPKLNRT